MIEEIENPDDPTLPSRKLGIEKENIEAAKPAKMAGFGNIPDLIRDSYWNNLTLMQGEGYPVTHHTPSFDFWKTLTKIEEKYKQQLEHASKYK